MGKALWFLGRISSHEYYQPNLPGGLASPDNLETNSQDPHCSAGLHRDQGSRTTAISLSVLEMFCLLGNLEHFLTIPT